MCVIAVVGDAPCQCFSPGSNQTTSPGRISSIAPPSRCTRPHPAVTMSVWPSGCVCHAVRAPGSKVTALPAARAGGCTGNCGSIRTVPVNHSAGPTADGCEPLLSICIVRLLGSCAHFGELAKPVRGGHASVHQKVTACDEVAVRPHEQSAAGASMHMIALRRAAPEQLECLAG